MFGGMRIVINDALPDGTMALVGNEAVLIGAFPRTEVELAGDVTCGTCNSTLVRQAVWLAATVGQRAAWKLAGSAVRAAPGKCRACYQRDYRKNLGCTA